MSARNSKRPARRTASPLEQAAAGGRELAHNLPAELLADFLEQAALPTTGFSFNFPGAVEQHARKSEPKFLKLSERIRVVDRLHDALPEALQKDLDRYDATINAIDAATEEIAFTFGVSAGLALAGIVNENAGVPAALVDAVRKFRGAMAKEVRGAR